MDAYWICYVEGTDGGKRYKHWTFESAVAEAERLAKLTFNRVYIYAWEGTCEVDPLPVIWEMPE